MAVLQGKARTVGGTEPLIVSTDQGRGILRGIPALQLGGGEQGARRAELYHNRSGNFGGDLADSGGGLADTAAHHALPTAVLAVLLRPRAGHSGSGLYTAGGCALPPSSWIAAFALPRSLNVRGGGGYHAVEDSGAARGSEGVMRFIVGILWIILMVFIILVFLNTPGIR
jgi:hypothetical protein